MYVHIYVYIYRYIYMYIYEQIYNVPQGLPVSPSLTTSEIDKQSPPPQTLTPQQLVSHLMSNMCLYP
jgi:hypothetical protein